MTSVLAKTRRAYDLAAEKYHALFHAEMEEKAYDRSLLDSFAAGIEKGSLVCDAGCGPSAHVGRHLFEKGMRVVGVDVSGRCLKIAERVNPGMRFLCSDIASPGVGDGAFDAVLSFYSVIHTPKKRLGAVFKEFHRMLKPGGSLLLAVKAGSGEGFRRELLGVKTDIYFSFFTEEEVERLLRDGGFAVDFLEKRNPYNFEIRNERIYAVGRKAKLREARPRSLLLG